MNKILLTLSFLLISMLLAAQKFEIVVPDSLKGIGEMPMRSNKEDEKVKPFSAITGIGYCNAFHKNAQANGIIFNFSARYRYFILNQFISNGIGSDNKDLFMNQYAVRIKTYGISAGAGFFYPDKYACLSFGVARYEGNWLRKEQNPATHFVSKTEYKGGENCFQMQLKAGIHKKYAGVGLLLSFFKGKNITAGSVSIIGEFGIF